MGSYGEEDWVRKELGNDEEVWAWAMGHLAEHAVIALATSSDEGPRVRPVTAVLHEDSVYILTSTDDAKVRHLEEDPRFEFYVLVKDEEWSDKGVVGREFVEGLSAFLRLLVPIY